MSFLAPAGRLKPSIRYLSADTIRRNCDRLGFPHPDIFIPFWNGAELQNLITGEILGRTGSLQVARFHEEGGAGINFPGGNNDQEYYFSGEYDYSTTPFTIIIDCHLDVNNSGDYVFFGRHDQNNWYQGLYQSGWRGRFGTSSNVSIASDDDGSVFRRFAMVSAGNIAAATWYIDTYKNGVADQNTEMISAWTGPIVSSIGDGWDGNNYACDGNVYRFVSWSHQLTAEQVAFDSDNPWALLARHSIPLFFDVGVGGTLYYKSLSGTMGAITGGPTRQAQRNLAGDMPASAGALLRQAQHLLAGDMPAAAGALLRATERLLEGDMPAAAGALLRQAQRLLEGDMPAPSGDLSSRLVYRKSLAGDMPAAAGTLIRQAQRLLAGDMPAAAGALLRQAQRLLEGEMPAPVGVLLRETQRLLEGDMPAPAGDLSSELNPETGPTYTKSLAGDMPAFAGTILRQAQRLLAGDMPAAAGALIRATRRLLAGEMPEAAGTLIRETQRILTGALPEFAGDLVRQAQRLLEGDMPAPSGTLSSELNPPETGTLIVPVVGSSFRRIIA